MPSFTTNYNLAKPNVNSADDEDLWGEQLNTNFDTIDAKLKIAIQQPTAAKTGAYTVVETDIGKTILVDATGGAVTITLLAAATAGDGFALTVKKVDASANAVTVDGDASETIDGATTYVLTEENEAVTVETDGTDWYSTATRVEVPTASDTVPGIIEIATAAEIVTGTDTTRAVTPGRMTNHWGVAKGMARVTGGGSTTSSKGNISSVSRTGLGVYRVTLSAAMSEIYAQVSMNAATTPITNAPTIQYRVINSTTIDVHTGIYSSGPFDPTEWTIAVYGTNT